MCFSRPPLRSEKAARSGTTSAALLCSASEAAVNLLLLLMQHFSLRAPAFPALHHAVGQLGALSRPWPPLNMTDAQRNTIKVQKVLLANSGAVVFRQRKSTIFFSFCSSFIYLFFCALLLFDPQSCITNPQHIPVNSLLNKAQKQSSPPQPRPPPPPTFPLRAVVLAL